MEQSVGPGSGAPKRILVIDVSLTVSLMICGLLRRWGHVAETQLPDSACDLVIADPATADPRLAELRRRGVPWLALLSAGTMREAADAAFWVHKPIQSAELQTAVTRCLETATAAPPVSGIDVGVIGELWESAENAGFRMVAKAFLREMDQCLAQVNRALAEEDRRRLAREAHSVVGAAANVGAPEISQAARAIEEAAPHAGLERLRALVDQLTVISRRDMPVLHGLIEA